MKIISPIILPTHTFSLSSHKGKLSLLLQNRRLSPRRSLFSHPPSAGLFADHSHQACVQASRPRGGVEGGERGAERGCRGGGRGGGQGGFFGVFRRFLRRTLQIRPPRSPPRLRQPRRSHGRTRLR
ncbi:hypothetical protein HJC23_013592 [Cyclotella cryptica]|uniref:Uncharacterized protein n=1 Tax=Cyclotella cryptica TaxID=29204 RepID=A0ABD3PQM2_9STRA|eukprot:CCRYP_012320-RA/>CCRYP_012320-RA protein AED:0.09 eAED:0.09 QI:160/1/1/1/0.5/0.66/3/810/125